MFGLFQSYGVTVVQVEASLSLATAWMGKNNVKRRDLFAKRCTPRPNDTIAPKKVACPKSFNDLLSLGGVCAVFGWRHRSLHSLETLETVHKASTGSVFCQT